MNIVEKHKEGLNLSLEVYIDKDVIKKNVDLKINKLSSNIKLAGFRKGKVPKRTIQQRYEHQVLQEVINEQIDSAIKDAIIEKNLNVCQLLGIENVNFKNEEGLSFEAKIELFPEIDINILSDVNIEMPLLKPLSDNELEEYILDMAKNRNMIIYEKEINDNNNAINGHQLIIDAIGYIDDKKIDATEIIDYKIVLGSNTFVDNFEEQLLGARKGEKKKINVTFPEDYHAKDLRGKEVEFHVEVKGIFEPEPITVNDQLAESFGLKDVEELKKFAIQDLENKTFTEIFPLLKLSLFQELDKLLNIDVPSSLLKKELINLKNSSLEDKEFINSLGKSNDELELYYLKLAKRRIKTGLFLAKYVKSNNIVLVDKDFNDFFKEIISSSPQEYVSDIIKNSKNQEYLRSVYGFIQEEKALKDIINSKKIQLKEIFYTKDQLDELIKKAETSFNENL